MGESPLWTRATFHARLSYRDDVSHEEHTIEKYLRHLGHTCLDLGPRQDCEH